MNLWSFGIFQDTTIGGMAAIFGYALVVGSAAAGAIFGTVRWFKKNRANALAAKAAEEVIIQGRIAKELTARDDAHKHALAYLERVAEGEKRLAEQAIREREQAERHARELQTAIADRTARITELSTKLEDSVDLVLNLQGQVSELKQSVGANRKRIDVLEQNGHDS